MASTKIILLDNIAKLGNKYSVKSVAAGYARNFLLPMGKAILATPKSLAKAELMKSQLEQAKQVQYELLKKEADRLKGVVVNLSAKANGEGHLYGAIHPEQIVEALNKDHGVSLDPSWIKLKNNIKLTGEHVVKIEPGIETGKQAPTINLRVVVSAE